MSGLRPVTVGIIGIHDVKHDLVCDVLNDHFGFGAEDSEGYFAPSSRYAVRLLIPCSEKLTGPGIDSVWQWAMRSELPYIALTDGTDNEFTGGILDNVMDEADVVDLRETPHSFVEQLAGRENPMLLVISDSDGALDETAEDVAAQALRMGLPVFDVARALLEIDWRHLPRHEPPFVEAEIVEEEGGQLALAVVPDDGTELVLTASDVASLKKVFDSADDLLTSLEEDVLARVATVRRDVALGRSLLAPKPDPTPEGGRQRLEVFNEKTGAWEKAGRGRPKAGVQKRYVSEPKPA